MYMPYDKSPLAVTHEKQVRVEIARYIVAYDPMIVKSTLNNDVESEISKTNKLIMAYDCFQAILSCHR